MKTSFSSSHDRNKHAKDNYMTPLTPQFFNHLIKLETDFNNKTYNAQTLDELTQYYAEAVEYYDSVKDPISSYFIFKIQDALTTKKSLGILIRESAKAAAEQKEKDSAESVETGSTTTPPDSAGSLASPNNKTKVTFALDVPQEHIIKEDSGDESSDDDDEEEKEKSKRRVQEMNKQTRGRKKSFGSMKNKKQKMFTLQLKLQSQKVHEKQSLTDFMSAFANNSKQIDQVVIHDINAQKNRIRNIIAKKKKDTMINYTQNSSGFLRDKGDLTIESVLKGLEDEDSMQNPSSNNSNDEKLEDNSEKAKETSQ